MNSEIIAIVFIILFVGFMSFSVYFIIKQIEFVLVSVNLYKKMVNNQEAIVKLLIDIRDKTKCYETTNAYCAKPEAHNESNKIDFSRKIDQVKSRACYNCGHEISEGLRDCPSCGAIL